MKVALVYDRINKWGGAERVLLALHKLFPKAPLFTSVYDETKAPWAKVFTRINVSFLQNFPLAIDHHELYAFLMPLAFESFNFDEYDLVISVTSEYAKAIITKPQTLHICYLLTPTRYLWSGSNVYLNESIKNQLINNKFKIFALPPMHVLRIFDRIAAERPDYYLAISKTVAERIRKYYQRESEVVYPGMDSDLLKFKVESLKFKNKSANSYKLKANNNKYFLIVSRLVPYKRIDLAIHAFNELPYQLKIIGEGSESEYLKSLAKNKIEFLGKLTDERLVGYYQHCEALIAIGEEDFGLTSIEAQYFGKPIICYQKGGIAETVVNGKTGVYFETPEKESIKQAVIRFTKSKFTKKDCYENALNYSEEKFIRNFKETVNRLWKQKQEQTGMD